MLRWGNPLDAQAAAWALYEFKDVVKAAQQAMLLARAPHRRHAKA